MDALALAVAAALLVVGAATAVARRPRPATAATCMGLGLQVVVLSRGLEPSRETVSLALAAVPLLAPMAAWGCTRSRASVTVALVAGLVAGPLRTLVYDPYYDLTCLTRCAHNPFALLALGHAMATGLLTVGLVAPVALTWAAASGPDRITLGLLALASWWALPRGGYAVEAATLAGTVLLARAGTDLARELEDRARVADLARALRAAEDVEETVGRAVGDPSLSVAYWLDDEERFVRSDGRLSDGTAAGLVATDIRGPDGLVARFLHDPGTDVRALADAVAGSARIALENGRLSARVRRQARRLQASRLRILTDADAERRRLERDLHDGAQQHLLALGLELNRAEATADLAERAVLTGSLAATQQVLDELRDLSHGFYPATLDQTGLGSALEGVADRSPVPMSVHAVPAARLPGDVERAIYLLVSRLATSSRSPLEVTITQDACDADAVVRGARVPEGVLPDVFAVLGGSVMSEEDQGVPLVRATLPLAPATKAVP